MKLRLLDRVILIIGAFLTALIGVCIFLIGLRMDALTFPDFSGGMFYVRSVFFVICGVILFIYGVYVMSLPQSYRKMKADFVVQQTADGEMLISVHAMDNLVRRVMESHEEMSLKSMDVQNRKDNVYIDLKVTVSKNVSIPLAVSSVQKDIKQYLLSSTGVDVREVKVTVDTADEEIKDSPYLMKEVLSKVQHVDNAQTPNIPFDDMALEEDTLKGDETERTTDEELERFSDTVDLFEDQLQEGDKQDNEGNGQNTHQGI